MFWFWKLLFWFLNHFYSQKSCNLGYSQSSNFYLKSLKIDNVPRAWHYICLKRPFQCVSNGIFVVQIQPKLAEKARCQFAWPLLWPCKFQSFKTPAPSMNSFIQLAKKIHPSSDPYHQIFAKRAKIVICSLFLGKNTENQK